VNRALHGLKYLLYDSFPYCSMAKKYCDVVGSFARRINKSLSLWVTQRLSISEIGKQESSGRIYQSITVAIARLCCAW
jgi:hypothetical protein